ncbi:MAG TPA: fused MFS/spermidine synthase [Gemmatimonadaceae bacterium]|nr:fused MFS/spermidine synthase [Gemmatimonadaceae bacterium]
MTTPTARKRLLVALFSATLFVNAALLFSVQPMFSKMVLPLLGGTPSVWNTCMLFFQTALLGGYLYAHLSARWLGSRRQSILHLVLLIASLATLPIAVAEGWRPAAGATPVPWLIALLSISIGAPFFTLSAGAPMLQRWFADTGHPSAHNPYFLYAASNLGSMLALLAYPLAMEPNLRLPEQSRLWTAVYIALIAMILGCALALRRRSNAPESATPRDQLTDWALSLVDEPAADESITWPTRLRWILLSFAPSSLLLGVTNYLTTDVAPIPLLWVIPLALYLLSFVVVFARRPPIPHRFVVQAQPVFVLALVVVFALNMQRRQMMLAPIHLAAFFITALVCHGELARSRPGVSRLTEFYLWISIGGMLGGVFNVLVAPNVFDTLLEYPIALAVACALRPAMGRGYPKPYSRLLDLVLPLTLMLALYAFVRASLHQSMFGRHSTIITLAIFALACLGFMHRPVRFALGIVGVLTGYSLGRGADPSELYTARSFYGVYKVRRFGPHHALQHGTTTHGGQAIATDLRREPLTYYHRDGPLGQLFASLLQTDGDRRVAIVGLGTGTIACYGRSGERWDFYEIDPLIERIARNPRFFTYLRDCPPTTRVVLGDARLSLADAPDGEYDLILLDAFSSDAIPFHLLTREAIALYMSKVTDHGAVALHISNRYVNLLPVLTELARDARLAGSTGADHSLTADQRADYKTTSRWVILSRHARDLASLNRQSLWTPLPADADLRPWTDDYSDILSVFKWK